MVTKLNLIAAACENRGIGMNGDLPWRLKKEMAFFTSMTSETESSEKRNAVIMGRRTWDCIPLKFRPLKNRLNIVLTKQEGLDLGEDAVVCSSLEAAVEVVSNEPMRGSLEKVWVIGGSSIYKLAMESPHCHRIYLTAILKDFACDTFFPAIGDNFKPITETGVPTEIQEENGISYKYQVFEKVTSL